MKKLLFILLACPCFAFGQGKFHGGDGSGYSSTSIIISSEGAALGLIEHDQLIFPNPVSTVIYLKKKTLKPSEISDIQGRIIKFIPLNTKEIDIRDLPPGSYFLHISGKTHRFTKTQ